MVSDVLFEASTQIQYYLSNPTFADTYVGDIRSKIARLVQDMDSLRQELDTPSAPAVAELMPSNQPSEDKAQAVPTSVNPQEAR